MNKAEKAELEAALKERRIALALRWSDPTQVPVPTVAASRSVDAVDDGVFGWLDHVHEGSLNRLPGGISAKWSRMSFHGDYSSDGKRSGGSQGGRILFATRLDALRAMRADYELIAAKRLAAIDSEIESEIAKPTPHPELKAKP